MTKSRDLANLATAGGAVSATELGFVDGVTSAIQTQLDAKLATATAATTYVPNSLADAKGDIFVATADNTVTRFPVSTSNGETIVADSSTSTGLRYQGNFAAGKNKIINGDFGIWQRGTTPTLIVNNTTSYGPDRFIAFSPVSNRTISRQATNDTTNLPNIQYCARFQRTSGNSATDFLGLYQIIETANSIPFAGKPVSLSFYARRGSNYTAASNNIIVQLTYGTGTDQNVIYPGFTGNSFVIDTTATLTTTWQRFAFTATVPTTSTQLSFNLSYVPVGTASTNDYFEMTGLQLEAGSVATAFQTATGTIQGELAACQRYYQLAGAGAVGANENTTFQAFGSVLPVTMRSAPTSGLISTTQTFFNYGVGTATQTISSIWGFNATTNGYYVEFNTASSGVSTVNKVIVLLTNNLGLSAEL